MCDVEAGHTADDCPVWYEIQVEGRLDEQWSEWLSGLVVAYCDGVTTLSGPIADQPALLGTLIRLGNMNLTLISVRRVDDAGIDLPTSPGTGEQ